MYRRKDMIKSKMIHQKQELGAQEETGLPTILRDIANTGFTRKRHRFRSSYCTAN
jgi:hypothetical protein